MADDYFPTFVAINGINAAKAERRMEQQLRCSACNEVHDGYECPVTAFTHVYGRRIR